jgi:hypothetical protein
LAKAGPRRPLTDDPPIESLHTARPTKKYPLAQARTLHHNHANIILSILHNKLDTYDTASITHYDQELT